MTCAATTAHNTACHPLAPAPLLGLDTKSFACRPVAVGYEVGVGVALEQSRAYLVVARCLYGIQALFENCEPQRHSILTEFDAGPERYGVVFVVWKKTDPTIRMV